MLTSLTLTSPMLTSLVRLPIISEPSSVEDIFSSALALIFPDDIQAQHGDPGSTVIYKSSAFGDIVLGLVDPVDEESRRRFTQYLWNSGVLMGEMIGRAAMGGVSPTKAMGLPWSVRGETVLELGAGTGLAGILSVLAGAKEVIISDYPRPEILANIQLNVEKNVPVDIRSRVAVQGHEWGNLAHIVSQSYANCCTRILAADCLWMPGEHHNLAKSMVHFLSVEESARIWVIAGFHTGRARLSLFFDVVVEVGLEVESIWERHVDGVERDWMAEGNGMVEDAYERKKWLLIAVLRRQRNSS